MPLLVPAPLRVRLRPYGGAVQFLLVIGAEVDIMCFILIRDCYLSEVGFWGLLWKIAVPYLVGGAGVS